MKTRPGPDTAMKRFWENNERFADLFNAVFFDGREVIKPELLTERNGDVSASVPIKKHYENVNKYQDVTKYYKGVELTILGIENQLRVNYAMPLRCRLYDDLDYLKECSALAGINKKLHNLSDPDEFLSGLTKEDRLHMSFRIVIYYGEKPWDGPRKLSDMVIVPEAFQPFFQDYAMPLIVISDPENRKIPYKNESVRNLMTQLYLLYNKNWEEIQKQNVSLDNDTAKLLESLIGSKNFKMNFKKRKGKRR